MLTAPPAFRAVEPVINPWLVAITVTLATFMELLDTSIANVSLPQIAGGLGTSTDEASWVLTSYLVANAVVLPMSAWLGRVFGRKNYYMACVACFTLSSFLCGIAPNLPLLIFFRVLQGIAGGGLAPSEQAILVDTFPANKRAGAFGLYSMAIVTAPAIGPTLGGWITDNFSWRWVFLINIPVGLLSLVLTSQIVKDPPQFIKEMRTLRSRGGIKIDYVGIGLIALGFGCLEVVLDKGQEDDWFSSPFITTFGVLALIGLFFGLLWEFYETDPVIDLSLLRDRNFALANVFYFVFGFTLWGSTLLVPQWLQSLEGYTATIAGLVLTPGAMLIVVLAPVVVRLNAKIGSKPLVLLGFSIIALAMWRYSQLDLTADYRSFVLCRMLQGLGIAMLFVPTSQIAYSNLPAEKNSKASSLTNLFRNEGGSFGIAFSTTLLARRSQFHQSVLGAHITPYDSPVQTWIAQMSTAFVHAGFTSADALVHAEAKLASIVDQQAHLLAYLDCHLLLALVALAGCTTAIFVQNGRVAGRPSGSAVASPHEDILNSHAQAENAVFLRFAREARAAAQNLSVIREKVDP